MKKRIKKVLWAFLAVTLVVTSFPFAFIMPVGATTISSTPSLIITELSANASLTETDPSEGFEFIEIKNTTDLSINLYNYTIQMYNTYDDPVAGTTAPSYRTVTLPEKTIAAGSVMVIWLQIKIAICDAAGMEISYAKYNEDTGNDESVAGDAIVNNSSII